MPSSVAKSSAEIAVVGPDTMTMDEPKSADTMAVTIAV